MSDTMTIELFTGDVIRMTAEAAGVSAELIREGRVVASACFASSMAARRWADAIIERAARSTPRVICINCDD